MAWTTTILHPESHHGNMDHTIKILRQTIVNNQAAKVRSVHTVPTQIAPMHVMSENAEYVKESTTNRAVRVVNSDSVPKKLIRGK